MDERDDYADLDLPPPWRCSPVVGPALTGCGILAVIGSGMVLAVVLLRLAL